MLISEEQMNKARGVDLIGFLARAYGLEIKKTGKCYTLINDLSVRFFSPENNKSGNWRYQDFSPSHASGGDAIEFLVTYLGVPFTDAVTKLAQFAGWMPEIEKDKPSKKNKPAKAAPALFQFEEARILSLPAKNDKSSRAIAYLISRGIDKEILYECLRKKIIYEDKDRHNVVFVGLDIKGNPRYAALRGTYTAPGKDPYKGEASGSDKKYSFCLIASPKYGYANTVVVTEAAIDALSYATLSKLQNGDAYKNQHILSLGGAYDVALVQFMKDHPEVNKVILCLDNDLGGRDATRVIAASLKKQAGITVFDKPMATGFKDANDFLRAYRENEKLKNEQEQEQEK